MTGAGTDDALAALTGDADPNLRAAACAAFPPHRPVPLPLIAALGDESRRVRVAAALAVLVRMR